MLFFALEIVAAFLCSLIILLVMRKVAQKVGLVDNPGERKLHSGSIPLVGGISICLSLLAFLTLYPSSIPYSGHFCLALFVLVAMGALDDKYDLSFKIRFLVQGLIALTMMQYGDVHLHSLGNLLGFGDINLDMMGYIITVFAVIGTINAFNMVDGIDGLLGGLSIVTIGAIGVVLFDSGKIVFANTTIVIIAMIVPYILLNLGFLGRKRKVFMGDAGSMMVGFMVVWFLLCTSQNKGEPLIRPVTALWFIAIPLMDMAAIMIRRIRRGDSPFKPDREHLHHIFQRMGFSSTQTLILICSIAVLYASFGYFGQVVGIPEYVMFYLFLLCFAVYATMLSYIWQITKRVRVLLGRNNRRRRLKVAN